MYKFFQTQAYSNKEDFSKWNIICYVDYNLYLNKQYIKSCTWRCSFEHREKILIILRRIIIILTIKLMLPHFNV